ncbi:MAG: endonuclease III, partial [Thermoplasmata archaeon]
AKALAEADVEDIANTIKPVGFYRVKARKIKEIAKIILDKYNGVVPKDMDELLKLPLVGRKTANCVLVFGYGIPAIPVDTHVHRISNRLGIISTKNPLESEKALMSVVPTAYWRQFNWLLVQFGRKICRPVRPKCDICPLQDICDYYKENWQK